MEKALQRRIEAKIRKGKRPAEAMSDADDFLTEFDAIYARYNALDYDAMPGEEVLARFEALEGDLLRRWGPVMVLDAVLATVFIAVMWRQPALSSGLTRWRVVPGRARFLGSGRRRWRRA